MNTLASTTHWLLPLACSLALTACDTPQRVQEHPPRPVKVVTVQTDPRPTAHAYAGVIHARHETELAFRVAGKIVLRAVEIGDTVTKSQLVARLDNSDYQLAALALAAQVQAAEAEHRYAKAELARYALMRSQNVISAPDYDRHETAAVAAQQKVAGLRAQLKQTANQQTYTDLLADRDGIVSAINAEQGQVVAAGQGIAKIAGLDEKEVRFDVPEQRVNAIKPQQNVMVTLWADAALQLPAQIREIAAVADPSSRTYTAKATLLQVPQTLQLGMTATVWLTEPPTQNLAIPLAAVFSPTTEPSTHKVWLFDSHTQTVTAQSVYLGPALADGLIAVTGLQAGQQVVSAGAQRLREGQAVRLEGAGHEPL